MAKKTNRLIQRQKKARGEYMDIQNKKMEKLNLHRKTLAELSKMTTFFSPTINRVDCVHRVHPAFPFAMDPDVYDYYKTATLPWTVCSIIVDHDIVKGEDYLDITQQVIEGDYISVVDRVYQETQEQLDKMNRRRRKNIGIICTVGDRFFDLKEINKILKTDPEFFECSGIITQKDTKRLLAEEIRLLERTIGDSNNAN